MPPQLTMKIFSSGFKAVKNMALLLQLRWLVIHSLSFVSCLLFVYGFSVLVLVHLTTLLVLLRIFSPFLLHLVTYEVLTNGYETKSQGIDTVHILPCLFHMSFINLNVLLI